MFPFSGSRRHGNVAKFLGEYAKTLVSNGFGAAVHQGNRVHARRNFRERKESHLPVEFVAAAFWNPPVREPPPQRHADRPESMLPIVVAVTMRKRNRRGNPLTEPQMNTNSTMSGYWLSPTATPRKSLPVAAPAGNAKTKVAMSSRENCCHPEHSFGRGKKTLAARSLP